MYGAEVECVSGSVLDEMASELESFQTADLDRWLRDVPGFTVIVISTHIRNDIRVRYPKMLYESKLGTQHML